MMLITKIVKKLDTDFIKDKKKFRKDAYSKKVVLSAVITIEEKKYYE